MDLRLDRWHPWARWARWVVCALLLCGPVPAPLTAQPASTAATAASDAPRLARSAELNARILRLPSRAVEAASMPGPAPAPPAPAAEAKASASAPAASARRYTPLPAGEVDEVRRLLSDELRRLKPGIASPQFAPFAGAVVTRTDSDAAPVALIPLAMVDDPLRFNAASGRFEGRIAVGLVAVDGKSARRGIGEPVTFQVIGAGDTDPDVAQVDGTSPPFATIRVAAVDPTDPLRLEVRSTGMKEIALMMPVQRAKLELSAKTRLQGWGLERTEVAVVASDGAASAGLPVTLQAARGVIETSLLQLDAQGRASTRLRSESVGEVLLTARSARHAAQSLPVVFEFPTRYLLAALVGGVSGGLLRHGRRRAGAKRIAIELGLAVLMGALVLGLFVLGVNLLGVPLPAVGGEVLVAVVAALGGFFGTGLLRMPG